MPGQKSAAKSATPQLKDKTLEAIAEYIKEEKVNRIVVLTGAGISTAAGIPDFRSKGTGLYDNLQKYNLPYPEAIFDIDYFMEKPEPFYTLAKEIYPGKFYPTKTHYFIKLLHDKGLLLRNFTQNIDTLERLTKLPEDMIVEAHGSFATASCVECHKAADESFVRQHVTKGSVARCKDCDGLVKPDITFFGENLPERFHSQLEDLDMADMLIVIGTSLKVQPFASLIDRVSDTVPRLLINKEIAGVHRSAKSGFDFRWKYGKRDVAHLGDCDTSVEELAALLGWKDELNTMYKTGNEKLKAQWAAESVSIPEPEIQDGEIDALADDLEKRLKVPEDKKESDEKTPKM
ncbi:DHS-like NAD/FAD-binding domain-containing protein [Dichotomocladium elegans]|nr:DHS-like NAD/FAD-binding domain-containing protein [Dichotomocladium elegans]